MYSEILKAEPQRHKDTEEKLFVKELLIKAFRSSPCHCASVVQKR